MRADRLQRGSLSRGQVVTLVVGVGLELVDLHAGGAVFGPIHPAHVQLASTGRPCLRPVAAPPGWTAHDDWVGLLRYGRVMGHRDETAELSYASVGGREGVELLRWLLNWARACPLPSVS